MTPITKPQADRLAALAVELRPATAPPWDVAGVRAAIADIRHDHDADDICHALITLAANPAVRTPAVLGRAGDHWPAASRPTPVPPPVVLEPPAPDALEVNRRGIAACRQALAHAKATA